MKRLACAVPILACLVALSGCATAPSATSALEDIYVLHSIREEVAPEPDWCAAAKTGFEPLPADAEKSYSFWSIQTDPHTGRVVDAERAEVAHLRGCFGPTAEPPRQNFYAEIALGDLHFIGRGECLALQINTPEPGLFPVRCQLLLSGLPAPYVGGTLTTNTLTSRAAFGAATDPPGYTQASIAAIRLWRARVPNNADSYEPPHSETSP